MANPEPADLRSLNIIRFALLAGTFTFGLVAWWVPSGQGVVPELVEGVEVYVWGGLILVFLALFGGVVAVRARWQAAETFEEKHSANIIGWAIAESGGLLGGLYLMMVGNPIFFGAGVALQVLASFILLPLPKP